MTPASKFSNKVAYGNNADSDQTAPKREQSDQGLHCLPFATDRRSIQVNICLFFHKNICCWCLLEGKEYHYMCFYGELRKISILFG